MKKNIHQSGAFRHVSRPGVSGLLLMLAMATSELAGADTLSWICSGSRPVEWNSFSSVNPCWESVLTGVQVSAPASGDRVRIENSGDDDLVVTYSIPGVMPSLDDLRLGSSAAGATTFRQNAVDGRLVTGSMFVADEGRARFYIDGGQLQVQDALVISSDYDAEGELRATGSASVSADILSIGYSGSGVLELTEASSLDSNATYLGGLSNSLGVANISGTGTRWHSGSTIVGEFGRGEINVLAGAQLTSGHVSLGYLGSGDVLIDGPGSRWQVEELMVIGDIGDGGLVISNGALVESGDAILGALGSAAYGEVRVDGPGSEWRIDGWLDIGQSGGARLDITNGARVYSGRTNLNENHGASSVAANIDGAGAAWFVSGRLNVGESGHGMLSIDNGAVLRSGSGALGHSEPDAYGEVTVNGAQSAWYVNGSLDVGDIGSGRLTLSNGASVYSQGGSLANSAGQRGDVRVSGDESQWRVSGRLAMANGGAASLQITDGGLVMADSVDVATVFQSSGDIQLSGPGSRLTVTETLALGTSGFAAMAIQDGAQVENADALVGGFEAAEVLVRGQDSIWTSHGDLDLDGSGLNLQQRGRVEVDGRLSARNDSRIHVDGGTLTMGSIDLLSGSHLIFDSGTLNLTAEDLLIGPGGEFGDSLVLTADQAINVYQTVHIAETGNLTLDNGRFSAGTLINNGDILLNNHASVLGGESLLNNGAISGNGTIGGALINGADGEVTVSNGDMLTFIGHENGNNGRIRVRSASLDFQQGLLNQGDLQLQRANNHLLGDIHNASGGQIAVTERGTVTFHHDLRHNGDRLFIEQGSTAIIMGELSGDSDIAGLGDLIIEGRLQPGNSPGLLQVAGNLTLGDYSTTLMELAGLQRGSEYDGINIGGQLTLNGELSLQWLDTGSGLFSPQQGDSFDLFLADNIRGEFDLLSLAVLDDGLSWQLSTLTDVYGNIDVFRATVVTAVPLPASFGLTLFGLLALLGMLRRHQ